MKSCKRATELMSLQLDRELTTSEQLGLKMHLMMCRHCRKCNVQFQTLHRLAHDRSRSDADSKR